MTGGLRETASLMAIAALLCVGDLRHGELGPDGHAEIRHHQIWPGVDFDGGGRRRGISDTLVSDFRMNDSFRLRPTGFNNAEGLSSLTWSNIARCYGSSDQYNCSTRRNGASYVTPEWAGFTGSWG
jgi:hypothetical protein